MLLEVGSDDDPVRWRYLVLHANAGRSWLPVSRPVSRPVS